ENCANHHCSKYNGHQNSYPSCVDRGLLRFLHLLIFPEIPFALSLAFAWCVSNDDNITMVFILPFLSGSFESLFTTITNCGLLWRMKVGSGGAGAASNGANGPAMFVPFE